MRTTLLARFPDDRRAPSACPTSCSTSTRRASWSVSGAILERIESDLRAAPVMAALRLALLHAILPASRLGDRPGRAAALRISSGHVRPHERDRSSASATRGSRSRTHSARVRGFIQRLDGRPRGPVQARLGEDLRSLGEGAATTRARPERPGRAADAAGRSRTPTAARPRRRRSASSSASRRCDRASSGWPRPTTGRRGSSAGRPRRSCRSTPSRARRCAPPWSWQADGDRPRARSGRAGHGTRRPGRPARRRRPGGHRRGGDGWRDRRVPRCSSARLADPDDDGGCPRRARCRPAAILPPGPRTRANVGLEPVAGRGRRPGRRARPRPLRAARARRPASVLRGRRGADRARDRRRDPARPRRAGPLRAAARRDPRRARSGRPAAPAGLGESATGAPATDPRRPGRTPGCPTERRRPSETRPTARRRRPRAPTTRLGEHRDAGDGAGEAGGPGGARRQGPRAAPDGRNRRSGRPPPRRSSATSSAGRRSAASSRSSPGAGGSADPRRPRGRGRAARRPRRVGGLQPPVDRRPDRPRPPSSSGWPRCSPATTCPTTRSSGPASTATAASPSTPDRVITARRPAAPQPGAHRAPGGASPTAGTGWGCGSGSAGASRPGGIGDGVLGDLLDAGEQRRLPRRHQPRPPRTWPRSTASGTSAARSRSCSRSSGRRCSASRSCAATAASRRTTRSSASSSSRRSGRELVRYKLERSPLLRGGARRRHWHIIKSDHLRTFLAREPLDLGGPGALPRARPGVERSGEQMPLFGG